MGSNYRWLNNPEDFDDDDPRRHIGKRSAAGLYCYDCGIYLTATSTQYAHMQHEFKDSILSMTTRNFEQCPQCGGIRQKGAFSSANRELGFKGEESNYSGIQGVSSFTWTMMSHKWQLEELITSPDKVVIDEYGQTYTAAEFFEYVLNHVMIEFQMYCEFF